MRWNQDAASTSTGRCSGSGPLGLVLLLGGVAAVIAYRQVPHRLAGREHEADRGPAAVRAVAAAGLPAPAVEGMRLALEPGRGRTAVPVRSVMAGAVLAMTVVSATLTFGASLAHAGLASGAVRVELQLCPLRGPGLGQRARQVGRPAAGPRPGGGRHDRGGTSRRSRSTARPSRPWSAPTRPAVAPAHPVRARARRQPRDSCSARPPWLSCTSGSASTVTLASGSFHVRLQDRGHGHNASHRRRAERPSLDEHRGAVLHGGSPRGSRFRTVRSAPVRAQRHPHPAAARRSARRQACDRCRPSADSSPER